MENYSNVPDTEQVIKQGVANTSGQGNKAMVPDEIKGWNLGAFFLTLIWGVSHRIWWSLLVFVPYAGVIMAIILGIMGNRWAWQAQHYNSVEEFKKREKKWSKAGFILILVLTIVYVAVTALRLIINPDELLKQSRYTQRINDAQFMESAINVFLANGGKLQPTSTPIATVGGLDVIPAATINASRATDGTGWVNGINFNPLNMFSTLPIYPTNSGKYGYIYYSDGKDYEIDVTVESKYYKQTAINDNGNNANRYEIGSKLDLMN